MLANSSQQIRRVSAMRKLWSCPRWMSSSSSSAAAAEMELPTRHSLNQPPRVCRDPVELEEETKRLLETPVGQLYASRATASDGRDEAYDLAYASIKRAEYLQFGYASQIVGSLYAPEDGSALSKSAEDPIHSGMAPLLDRMKKEGDMYMKMRHGKRMVRVSSQQQPSDFTPGSSSGFSTDEEGYLPSSDDSDSSSSDDDSDDDDKLSSSLDDSSSSDDDSDEDSDSDSGMSPIPSGSNSKSMVLDFAPPGVTAKMHEAMLDVMACVGEAAPSEYYETALQILDADDLDKGSNSYTLPSHVTYNASLRGIAQCDLSSDESIRDDALSSAFALYNHLTHSLHLPRNTMTMVYMLQVVDKALPASRVKGNISVTLWDHASRLGVVNDEVIAAMNQVHDITNGPEFDALLKELASGGKNKLPQKHRRFINKYRHSKHY